MTTPVHGMAPELVERALAVAEKRRDLGLAAGNKHDEARLLMQGEANGIVGGGIAGVQRGHNVDLAWEGVRVD